MVHEATTTLESSDVIAKAKSFFRDRVPHYGAFLDSEGESFVTFRGRGGEEITIAVIAGDEYTRVRASSLLYDQAIGRFFSTLPRAYTVKG